MSVSISELVEEKLQSEDLDLPVCSPVATQLQELLASEDFNMEQAAELIQQDQAIAGQLLRMSNSAFFSGLGEVTTVQDALVRLGVKQVSNLVMLVTQKRNFTTDDKVIDDYLERLWDHSVACAVGASWLAQKLGYRGSANEAFLAGLLHDFGMLFLLRVLAELKAEVQQMDITDAVIVEILSKMHCEQGERLMAQWNVPDVYRHVAKLHHTDPGPDIPFMVNIVRLADIVVTRLGVGFEPQADIVPASTAQAVALNAGEVMLAEMEIVVEDALGLAGAV